MDPEELDDLQQWLCDEARSMFSPLDLGPVVPREWWSCVFADDLEEDNLLDTSARAFAHDKPLPKLSPQQKSKLAMRLRLGSRIARTISQRGYKPLFGWFPEQLRQMSRGELLEWILVDAWPFVSEIFGEAQAWLDEQPWPDIELFDQDPSPQILKN